MDKCVGLSAQPFLYLSQGQTKEYRKLEKKTWDALRKMQDAWRLYKEDAGESDDHGATIRDLEHTFRVQLAHAWEHAAVEFEKGPWD